jgi:4-amino-4-deoxy-L-arabinose transferase-like glycosyltransferase
MDKGLLTSFLNKFFDKGELKNLLYIGLGGLLLRVVYIFETQGTPFFNYLFSDSEIYNQWALEIAEKGNWIGDEVFFMAPPYPYILGLIYLIIGQSLFSVRIIQALVSTANIFVIYLIGRNLHSSKAGYISAAAASIYSVFIFYSGAVLSETYQIFIVSILIYYISLGKDNFSNKYWFKVGFVLGFAALFRANILLFFAVLIIWFLVRLYRSADLRKPIIYSMLFLTLGTALPILPVTLRNYLIEDDIVLLTSNGGINFYIGNNKRAVGVFLSPKEFDFYSDLSGRNYVENKLGYKVQPSEVSAYWYEESLDFFKSEPLHALLLNIKKIFMFMSGEEYPQSTVMNIDYFRDNYSDTLKLPLINFYMVSILSLFGLMIYFKDPSKNNLIILLLLSYILASSIFFISGRFRLAITPLLIFFAAYALIKIYHAVRDKKYNVLKFPAAALIVFLLVDSFIIFKPKYNYHDAYIHLGDVAYKEEDFDKAIEYYNRSLFYQDSYVSYVNIGNAFAIKKDFRNAISSYNKAITRNPEYSLAYFNLAFAYTQQGNLPKAEEAYKRVLELDPKFEGAYRNLGITYYVQERYEEALYYFERYMEISTDEITKENVRIDIENIKRMLSNPEKAE